MKLFSGLVIAVWLTTMAWSEYSATVRQAQIPEDALKLVTDLVVLDVEAVSKKTRLAVPGLSKDDLVVYEDGAKQHISYFSQDSLPLSIVILLDVSGSVASNFDRLQGAAATALARLKVGDEVALMVFGGSARVLQDLTSNRRLISDSIVEADATGLDRGTDVNEAIYRAAAYLERASAPTSRRVIIAITDDTTSLNVVAPRPDSSALKKIHEARSVVCGLIFYNPYKRALIGNTTSIRTYAEASGGKAVNAESKKLEANLTQIIHHLRTRYSLGYVSSNEKRDGSFRKIKVEASPETIQRIGQLDVLTRKGYYAPGQPTTK